MVAETTKITAASGPGRVFRLHSLTRFPGWGVAHPALESEPEMENPMSKGLQIVPVRMSADLISEIDAAIRSAEASTHATLYSRSTWIRKAIVEKLDHTKRAKKVRKRKGGSTSSTSTAPFTTQSTTVGHASPSSEDSSDMHADADPD